MCKSKKPKYVPPVVTVIEDPVEQDEEIKRVRDNERKKAKQMLGRQATILTGSDGLTDEAKTKKKSLLGS